jgi:hypothetical protein
MTRLGKNSPGKEVKEIKRINDKSGKRISSCH